MSNHAINIATNGLIEISGTSISTFGYILEEYWKEAAPVLEEIISGGTGIDTLHQIFQELPKEKKKKVIKLILWYKGKEYQQTNKIVDYSVNVKNIETKAESYQVSVTEIENIVKEYKELKKSGKITVKIDDIKVK